MARKRTKKGSKKADADLSEMERLVADGKAEVEAHLETLRARREALESPEHLDENLIKLTNSLTKSIAALSAEQRQLEKHTRTRLENLGPEDEDAVVLEFLEELPRDRRRKFLDFLQELEGDNDLLSL